MSIVEFNMIYEIPIFSYKIEEEKLILILYYKNEKEEKIEVQEFEKNCAICSILLQNKNYAYIFHLKKYVCLNCIKTISKFFSGDNFKKLNIGKDLIIKSYEKYIDFNNNFDINNSLTKKFYGIFSYFFENFKLLYSNNLYNKELNINLNAIVKIKFDKINSLNGNCFITSKNGNLFFLFDEFYNEDFKNYYNTEDFLLIFQLIQIYKQYKIKVNNYYNLDFKLDMNKTINELERKVDQILTYIKSKTDYVNLNYELQLSKLENEIKNYYSKIEYIPLIYLLKRRFSKLIIDCLYCVYFNKLEDVEPNYNSLYYFYKRIYNAYSNLKDNKLKIKLQQILSKLKKILLERNEKEKHNLLNDDIEITFQSSKVEFNNNELEKIKTICSKLEKQRKEEKCEYNYMNEEYIILKFIISFLNFIIEKSNLFIHILIEKYSENYYFKQLENKNTLKEFILMILNKEHIHDKINFKELIYNLFFEDSQKNRLNNILDQIEILLDSDSTFKIEDNSIYEKYLDNQNEIKLFEKNLIKIKNLYENLLNMNQIKKNLGEKEDRNQKSYNTIINEIINLILNKYNNLQKEIEKNKKYINNILRKNNHIYKMQTIINEIKSKTFEEFSLSQLFNLWKEKEMKKISNLLIGEMFLIINEKLKKLTKEDIENFLFKFYKKNEEFEVNFYNEEPDLKLNLFLYKNNINPNIIKLIYKYIEN